ncbi:MAG: TIGR04282 family arsenosugar biosynthesis glycosyltransferase [Methylibium sp.]|nr:TIGR04282 family arsenosugar biosynthesis glycosyltransferase [Methylibium sp.]
MSRQPTLLSKRCAFAIMAKASEPGRVKTRLVPPLSMEHAATLNTCFLADVSQNILTAADSVPIDGYVAYATTGSEAFFRANLAPAMRLLPPREMGLGQSLHHASADLLAAGYGAVCLVNSDSPTLPTEILVETARILLDEPDRVVLGPCDDGGYYLIGMARFQARLFEDIAWSTDRVFAQTLERAAEIGVDVARMPQWYDVDDAASLARLEAELRGHGAPAALRPFRAPRSRAYLCPGDASSAAASPHLEPQGATGVSRDARPA